MLGQGSTCAPSAFYQGEGGLEEEAGLADLGEGDDGAEDGLGELILSGEGGACHVPVFGGRGRVGGAEGHGAKA